MQWPLVRSPVAPLCSVVTLCGNSPLVLSPPSREPRPREAGGEFSPRQRPDLGWRWWFRAEPQQQQPPLGRCCCRVGRPLHSRLRSREPPARQESALACRRATLPTGRLIPSTERAEKRQWAGAWSAVPGARTQATLGMCVRASLH